MNLPNYLVFLALILFNIMRELGIKTDNIHTKIISPLQEIRENNPEKLSSILKQFNDGIDNIIESFIKFDELMNQTNDSATPLDDQSLQAKTSNFQSVKN